MQPTGVIDAGEAPTGATMAGLIYLVGDGRPVAVERDVTGVAPAPEWTSSAGSADSAVLVTLQELYAGPLEAEARAGLTTAIDGRSLRYRAPVVTSETVVVFVGDTTSETALAQISCTVRAAMNRTDPGWTGSVEVLGMSGAQPLPTTCPV